ncbi:MAG: T9SS type A sorting domain-containing protein [Chitinophagales bacterium]
MSQHQVAKKNSKEKSLDEPADNFYFARTYPFEKFALQSYKNALSQAQKDYENKLADSRGSSDSWVIEGPYNINGRLNTVAVNPDDNNTILVGLAAGGIFKSVDNAATWYSVFDEFSYLAISHIVYDPYDGNVVYAGTGDANISGYPFIGDGIYKSLDGGESWSYSGLSETGIVSKIIVHPSSTNIIYAATMGLPFERNIDRGLYKSTDAGATWEKILYVDDDAGIIDICSDPENVDVIYAASWNRIRNNHESLVYGDDAHIYKSTDGGVSWEILGGGFPDEVMSRISIEINPEVPETLYACYVNSSLGMGGIYKTTNGGEDWVELDWGGIADAFSGFGWYFDGIQINTKAPESLFVQGVGLYRTTNDGDSWEEIDDPTLHADKHAMYFRGVETYFLCTDGGLYRTTSDADHWTDVDNIPSTQFYHVDQNVHEPGIYYGGFQDNGTKGGNESTGDEWFSLYGADGFHTEFRTDDPDVFYVEYQNGGLIVFDGFDYYWAGDGIDDDDRTNWNTPYILSKHDDDVLYAGTYRVYRSDAGVYPLYDPISDDLTDGVIYEPRFHTVTVIEESDYDAEVLFAGTTDANVHRTTDGGDSWENITADLPEQFVTDIAVSHTNENTVFVSHSGYRENDFVPHIHKSTDLGDSWTDISGDLPDLAVNAIVVYPTDEDKIFVATDGGVYYTTDGGSDWERLGNNMPVIPVYDLEYDAVNNKIIAGTHARACWSISLDEILPLSITVSSDTSICAGQEVMLTASGAVTYSWEPASSIDCDPPCETVIASPTETTTYTVTGTDALGNTATETVTVIVNPIPPESLIETDANCFTITNHFSTLNYQWFDDEGTLLPGETDFVFCADVNDGECFYVVVTNAAGCTDTSAIVCTILESVSDNSPFFQLYENPSGAVIMFTTSLAANEMLIVKMYDIKGAEVKTTIINNQSKNIIDISTLSIGSYFLEVRSGNKKAVRKFVKM